MFKVFSFFFYQMQLDMQAFSCSQVGIYANSKASIEAMPFLWKAPAMQPVF